MIGIAGIGKTQTLRAYRSRHEHDYQHSFYFETNRSASRQYYQLAETYFPSIYKHVKESDIREKETRIYEAIKSSLRAMKESWLILIDDHAEGIESNKLSDYYPRNDRKNNAKHHILIATRKHHPAPAIHLTGFTESEAIRFIASHELSDDETHYEALAKLLKNYPLAIEQAITYIHHSSLNINDYIQLYSASFSKLASDENQSILSKIEEDFSEDDGFYGKTLLNTLQLSLSAVYKKDMMAKRLLLCSTLIHPSRIPRCIFETYIQKFSKQGGEPLFQLNEVLNTINTQSLLQTQLPQKLLYELHPIVHKYIYYLNRQNENDSEMLSSIIVEMTTVLSSLFTYAHELGEKRDQFELMLQHVECFIQKHENDILTNPVEPPKELAKLYYTLGVGYQHRTQNYEKSIEFLQKAKGIQLNELAFKIDRQLAKAYSRRGDIENATSLYETIEKTYPKADRSGIEWAELYLDMGIFHLYKKTPGSEYRFQPLFSSEETKNINISGFSAIFVKQQIVERYFNLSEESLRGYEDNSIILNVRAQLDSYRGHLYYKKADTRLVQLNAHYILEDLKKALFHVEASIIKNKQQNSRNYDVLGKSYLINSKIRIKMATIITDFPKTSHLILESELDLLRKSQNDLKEAFWCFYEYYGDESSKFLLTRSKNILKQWQKINQIGANRLKGAITELADDAYKIKYLTHINNDLATTKRPRDQIKDTRMDNEKADGPDMISSSVVINENDMELSRQFVENPLDVSSTQTMLTQLSSDHSNLHTAGYETKSNALGGQSISSFDMESDSRHSNDPLHINLKLVEEPPSKKRKLDFM